MFKILLSGGLIAIALSSSAWAGCKMPSDAGRHLKSQSKQLYAITYKEKSYTYWRYKGWDSRGQTQEHEVILRDCKLAYTGQGGQDVSWSIGIPKAVAIAFAKKEAEQSVKRLGREKIQAALIQSKDYGLQPEWAEAYKALGFQLPSGIKIYPWLERR
jgi:hypothetical protein